MLTDTPLPNVQMPIVCAVDEKFLRHIAATRKLPIDQVLVWASRSITVMERMCMTHPWPLREVRAFLELSGEIPSVPMRHQCLVCVMGARLAGYALVTYRPEETQLHRLATLPDSRGRGVARCLLAAVDLHSRRRRAGAIYCVVRESNLAGQLCLKACGYRAPADNAIQHDAFVDGETGYVLIRDLGRPVQVRIVE